MADADSANGGAAPIAPFSLPARLSVVFVTSPTPSNPSTELTDAVVNSLRLVGCEDCELIIVGDGVKVRDSEPKSGAPNLSETRTAHSSDAQPTDLAAAPAWKRSGAGRGDNPKSRSHVPKSQRVSWKRGQITKLHSDNYHLYMASVRAKYASRGKVIGPLPERVGFGHALLTGLRQVTTEFVLVVQHDRAFVERLEDSMLRKNFAGFGSANGLHDALAYFDLFPGVRYIGFQSTSTLNYASHVKGRFGAWSNVFNLVYGNDCEVDCLEAMLRRSHENAPELLSDGRIGEAVPERRRFDGVTRDGCGMGDEGEKIVDPLDAGERSLHHRLMPLFFWYDSTHVCRTNAYIELIEREVKVGQFPESTYGMRQEQDLKKIGLGGGWSFRGHLENSMKRLEGAEAVSADGCPAVNPAGSFLMVEASLGLRKPITAHLHGRDYWTDAERAERGWPLIVENTKYDWLKRIAEGRGVSEGDAPRLAKRGEFLLKGKSSWDRESGPGRVVLEAVFYSQSLLG